MTTLLLLLLLMGLPAAVLLIAGIWAVRKKYGGVLQILGIVSIALGMLLGVVTILAVPGIATTTTNETDAPAPSPWEVSWRVKDPQEDETFRSSVATPSRVDFTSGRQVWFQVAGQAPGFTIPVGSNMGVHHLYARRAR